MNKCKTDLGNQSKIVKFKKIKTFQKNIKYRSNCS